MKMQNRLWAELNPWALQMHEELLKFRNAMDYSKVYKIWSQIMTKFRLDEELNEILKPD